MLLSQGQTVGDICRSFNISEYTYSLAEGIRWDPYRSSAPAEGTREREYPTEEASGRTLAGQRHIAGDGPGKLISPARRRQQHGRHDFPIDAAQSSRSSSRTDDVHVGSTFFVPAGMAPVMNEVHPPLPKLDSVVIAWPRTRFPPRSDHVAGRDHGPGRCGECHLDRRYYKK